MTIKDEYDAIVVGGGPAGLQAGLSLARVHRSVLVIDSGRHRNDPAAHMHNVITHDGRPPAEFRAAARADLAAYGWAEVVDATVDAIDTDGDDFVVTVDGRPVRAHGVVLATGLVDTMPDVPGLTELWGDRVAACPFCHGHELSGGAIGVLGVLPAGHLPGVLAPMTDRVVVLTDGETLPEETVATLPAHAEVRTEPLSRVVGRDGGLTVELAAGDPVDLTGLFVMPSFAQRAPFAERLRLELNPSGCVRVDVMGRTSVPGVHAAGDMAHQPELTMPMVSVVGAMASGAIAGAAMVHRLASRASVPTPA